MKMQTTYSQKTDVAQRASDSSAESLVDSSSQGESLQRKADMANNAAQRAETPRPNNTGMPDNLKAGIESISGFSMDDVRVHYNSSKPATVQALAYTQGTDIHVAPGQEKCLPHEAWHVAQQMAGRVSPTTNINGMPVNDNAGLEHEADVMGEKVINLRNSNYKDISIPQKTSFPFQLKACVKITEKKCRRSISSQYLVKKLGSGSFGSAYETDRGYVVKTNNKNPDELHNEFLMLDKMYEKNAYVVRPYGYGKIQIKDENPKDFDSILNDTPCMLMEKISILKDPTKREQDLNINVEKIVSEEFEIFKKLMALRNQIISRGYVHFDIKHNNVGYRKKGRHLRAIDVGISMELDASNPKASASTKIWSQKMCEKLSNGCWRWQDDVCKSFLLTLIAIEKRCGVFTGSIGQKIIPNDLENSYKEYRLTDFSTTTPPTIGNLNESKLADLQQAVTSYYNKIKRSMGP